MCVFVDYVECELEHCVCCHHRASTTCCGPACHVRVSLFEVVCDVLVD